MLGADKGGLGKNKSLAIMEEYLSNLEIDIEIYEYSPKAFDDVYLELRNWLLSEDIARLSQITKIRTNYLEKVIQAMSEGEIHQVNQLVKVKGVGVSTIEKLFACKQGLSGNCQDPLF